RFAESRSALAESAHARQHQSSRFSYQSGVARYHCFDTHCLERLLDAAQVADTVIDYRNHKPNPQRLKPGAPALAAKKNVMSRHSTFNLQPATCNLQPIHRVPFVDSTPSIRSEIREAAESALAADLKTASVI